MANIDEMLSQLRKEYPDARYELDWNSPFELLIATILAAQASDERVNQVTPDLFQSYPDAESLAQADRSHLEQLIRTTGYYRKKAKTIQEVAQALVGRFGGEVPRSMEELVTLPGVARKTANVVLNTAFDIPSGIIVDIHVARVAPRIGLTTQKKPEKIEEDLMALVPEEEWTFFGPAMVLHGRYTCTSSAPRCGECVIEQVCQKNLGGVAPAAPGRGSAKGKEAATKTAASKKKAGARKKAGAQKPKAASQPAPAASDPGGSLFEELPQSWREVLSDELDKPYIEKLEDFVARERAEHTVFPPQGEVFTALELTPYEDVNVFLLGQDPYHDNNQAHGLCFSVRPGIRPPPSLVNIYKELRDDVGFEIPNHGYLVDWAKQGILMLNAVLTVRAHKPNSHKGKGWEKFTDAVIRRVNDKPDPVVFVFWGSYAQKKKKLLDADRHVVIEAPHPSPLSASRGFFGSRCFSAVNEALGRAGKPEIDWQLEDI